jgi:hypothetical protein
VTTNWGAVALCEIELKNNAGSWTQDGTYTNCWYLDAADDTFDAMITKVEEDGSELTEESSVSDCNSTAGSWYYDSSNERLYVHTTGSDNVSNYTIVYYFWELINNKAGYEASSAAPLPSHINGKPYLDLLDHKSIQPYKSQVGNFHEGGGQKSGGTIRIANHNARYDTRLYNFIYSTAKILIKVGEEDDDYDNFYTIVRGWITKQECQNNYVTLTYIDYRELL